MASRFVIGLSSSSRGDGAEAVLLNIDGIGLDLRIEPVQALRLPHPKDVRTLLQQTVTATTTQTRNICLLHRLLGETFAAAARLVADRAGLSLQQVQCIGCPGHTLWHESEGRFPATLTIGTPAIVAERTGVTTVSDFRDRDLAAGGQAAPLSAVTDFLLFRDETETRVVLHLGDVARLVYLPAGGRLQEVLGFDVGPCTGLLDTVMRHLSAGKESYDPGGKHAVQGHCIDGLLERWLEHPYLQRRPPKSFPRNGWDEAFAIAAMEQARQMDASLHDLLCTCTHFVATGIVQSIQRFLPALQAPVRVLLSGGGVRNGLLWRLLEQQLADMTLDRTDPFGVPSDIRRAVTAGLLATLTIDGVPASVPSATGASGTRLLGCLTPGSSANWARCLAWMASLCQLSAAA